MVGVIAVESQEIFVPARFGVRPKAVPFVREQDEQITGLNVQVRTRRGLQNAVAARDRQKLILRKHAALFPRVEIRRGMVFPRGIGLSMRKGLISRIQHAHAPNKRVAVRRIVGGQIVFGRSILHAVL